MTAPFDPASVRSARPAIGLTDGAFDAPRHLRHPSAYRRFGKRMMDMALVIAAAPFVLSFVALLAALIAFDGGKPFFSQLRVGRNGRTYRMWKLRTMVVDADERLRLHLEEHPDAMAEWLSKQKLRNDPRVTAMGRFLRKTSLDELPQLWNVFIGDMSLVGPRPIMPEQQALYTGADYYDLRPGITGPWQVYARNTSSFADRAAFDASYHRALNLGTDARLIFATLWVVFQGTGH